MNYLLVILTVTHGANGPVKHERGFPMAGITACERTLAALQLTAGPGMAVTALCRPNQAANG